MTRSIRCVVPPIAGADSTPTRMEDMAIGRWYPFHTLSPPTSVHTVIKPESLLISAPLNRDLSETYFFYCRDTTCVLLTCTS
jgi:hypothetical protein